MTESLAAANSGSEKTGHENGRRDGGRFIAIKDFHYHANDLAELRKLAEVDPLLADKVIEQRDREHAREKASYNFGMLCTIGLLAMVLVAFTCLLIFTGLLATMVAIGGILAVALLVRVILTGEWSDTTWFGKLLNTLVKALGGRPADDGDTRS